MGAMLACLFVGWYIPKDIVRSEFTNNGTLRGRMFSWFLFGVRVVCPIGITIIFLHQLGIV
jgi:NSS family neurotransmitter:Na+ symporter